MGALGLGEASVRRRQRLYPRRYSLPDHSKAEAVSEPQGFVEEDDEGIRSEGEGKL